MHKAATTVRDKDVSFLIDILKTKEELIKNLTEAISELECKLVETTETAQNNRKAGRSWQDKYLELVKTV